MKKTSPKPPDINGKPTNKHFLLFTGHMIDQPGRKKPRFPPEKEPAARIAIADAVQREKEINKGNVEGLAGGACGGDILFHEVCEVLHIPSQLFLALPRDQFVAASVQFAGTDWIKRFDRLYKKKPTKILPQTQEQAVATNQLQPISLWEQNNLWMLFHALVSGSSTLTLIALWDGKGGDGPGGTEHLVKAVQERGGKTVIIDTNTL